VSNYRKNVDVYSEHCMPEQDKNTTKVFRPNSMRQVSAVKELNRLTAYIKELEKHCKQSHVVDAKTISLMSHQLGVRLLPRVLR